jgi:Cu/Ag efflux protein CusF
MTNARFHSFKIAAFAAATIPACFAATNAGALEAGNQIVVAQVVEKASGEGVIKGVNADERKIQIAHGAIPALKWPAMTMAFGVAPNVDLAGLATGAKVKFTFSRDAKGLYLIDEIRRAE